MMPKRRIIRRKEYIMIEIEQKGKHVQSQSLTPYEDSKGANRRARFEGYYRTTTASSDFAHTARNTANSTTRR